MGLLSIFNRFTRRFRKKKKRKTRRRRGGTGGQHSPLAKKAILRNAKIKVGLDPNAKYYTSKIENKSPEKIMAEKKSSSGRISPPPQSPFARPGKSGGRRKKKTRRRKGGAGGTHSTLARQAMCQKKGGTWLHNKCHFTNPQEGSGKSRRRRRRRKR